MTETLEGGEWSAARPRCTLPPGKDPVPIVQEAGWAPGPVWTGGKSRPRRDSIPDRPRRSQLLYRLSYLDRYFEVTLESKSDDTQPCNWLEAMENANNINCHLYQNGLLRLCGSDLYWLIRSYKETDNTGPLCDFYILWARNLVKNTVKRHFSVAVAVKGKWIFTNTL